MPQGQKPAPRFGGWTALSTCFIALVLAFVALKALGTVLKPLAFAWILMLALAPLVKFITRRLHIPEIVAILLAMAFTILFFFELGSFVNSLVSSFVAKFGYYADKLKALLAMLYDALPDKAVTMLREFDWIGGVQQHVVSLSGLVISASSTTAIVLIITAFLLIERRDFAKKVASASSGSRNINAIIGTISTQVSRYLILQCLVSAATGIAVWLALWMIGIDFAVTWGFLAFLLNFIPTIGSILASVPPLVIALVQYAPDSYIPFFVALAAILAIQMLIGNVVSPRVMGNRLDISPVVILISLPFWTWLWGIPGALLATPFTAAIKIICDNIEPLKPVGILLGSGRQFRNFGKNGRSRRRRRFRNKEEQRNEKADNRNHSGTGNRCLRSMGGMVEQLVLGRQPPAAATAAVLRPELLLARPAPPRPRRRTTTGMTTAARRATTGATTTTITRTTTAASTATAAKDSSASSRPTAAPRK